MQVSKYAYIFYIFLRRSWSFYAKSFNWELELLAPEKSLERDLGLLAPVRSLPFVQAPNNRIVVTLLCFGFVKTGLCRLDKKHFYCVFNISVNENYLFLGRESTMNMTLERKYKSGDKNNKCRSEPTRAQALCLKSTEPNPSFSSNPIRTKSRI